MLPIFQIETLEKMIPRMLTALIAVAALVGSTRAQQVYFNTVYTTLDAPNAVRGTSLRGISGSNIVGIYLDGVWQTTGFLYDGSTWSPLDAPNAVWGTYPMGISGVMWWDIIKMEQIPMDFSTMGAIGLHSMPPTVCRHLLTAYLGVMSSDITGMGQTTMDFSTMEALGLHSMHPTV